MARTLRPSHPGAHRPMPVADLDHALATATVAMGVVGLLLVAVGMEAAGTWLGLAGVVVGLVAQMWSRTRGERFVDMAGLLACFMAFAVGAAQGGL